MADFTDLDKEQLDQLRKALEKSAATETVKQPWQEHFERNTTAKSGKSILAAEIIKGFSGSWAASYNYAVGAGITPVNDNVRKADTETAPVPVRAKTTKLGRRGVPDIDFVPYSHRTNRFGSKGPSLVGHPISFEVLGPTLKSPFCDWAWQVDAGTGPNGGDELTMTVRPDGNAAVASTLGQAYGLDIPVFTMGDSSEPNGGVYVLIADDGVNPGSTPAGTTPMGALPQFLDTARYELFRVVSARANVLELHPDKPLGDYFDLSTSPRAIRAITVVRPYVTRLVAIPGSGAGSARERVFAVVSPETSASSDLYPPFDGGAPGDGSWNQGGFDANPGESPSTLTGALDAYMGRQPLPIPQPLDKRLGNVHTASGALPPAPGGDIGEWFIMDHPSSPISSSPDDVGLIARVYNIESQDDTDLTFGTPGATLGWFPVVGHQPAGGPPPGLIVSRSVEVDPTSGHLYFGPGPYLDDAGGPKHDLVFSMHEPVSRLWDTEFFNVDKVEACRLKNLIDPRDVSRWEKQTSEGGTANVSQPGGASFSGPERAIWDTTTASAPVHASNPGSLLDLGFRMVLFPSKDDGSGNPIPDFERPIDTRGETVIDPAIQDETQFVEVDYDGGIVRLSHSPPAVAGGDIVPNGIIGGTGTTNPRGEVVLWAACVPYSMEESQLGTGARVVGRSEGTDFDAYSDRVTANIDQVNTNSAGSAPFIGASGLPPNPVEIVLDRIWEGPNSGVFEITEGPQGESFGLWGYTETRTVNNGTEDVTALGGISSLPTTITDPTIGGADPRSVVMRREVFFAEKSFSKDFGTDNSTNDTTYGSAQRASAIRFTDAKVKSELDGSVTVTRLPADPPGTLGFEFFQWGHLGASQGNASGVANLNDFSTFGFFAPDAYDSTLNGQGDKTTTLGNYGSDAEGPFIVFDEVTQFNYRGVMAATNLLGANPDQSQIIPDARIRLVVKFRYIKLDDSVGFVGLSGTANPGVTDADVNQTVTAVPSTDLRILGIRIPDDPATDFEFVTQGSGGFNTVTTTIPVDTNLHYFVLETTKDLAAPVKMALYDAEFNLEASHIEADATLIPSGTQDLSFIGGVRKLGNVDRPKIRIYYASAVLRYDLAKG